MGLFLTREEVQAELAQTRALFEGRVAQMQQELLNQLQPRSDAQQALQQVRADVIARVEQSERALLTEIHRTHSLGTEVKDAVLQHSHSTPRFPAEIYQTPNAVNHLHNRINGLSEQLEVLTDITENMKRLNNQVSVLSQTITQISPNGPTGERKHIHGVIEAHTETIKGAINNILFEHSQWLGELLAENDKLKQALQSLDSIADSSRARLAPKSQVVEAQPLAIEQEQDTPEDDTLEEPRPLE